MTVTKLCRVVDCPEIQHGAPLCETHWRWYFLGFCVVDGCDSKPPRDEFACQEHAGVWQRPDHEVFPTATTAAASAIAADRADRDERIRELRDSGMTYTQITAEIGCTEGVVSKVLAKSRGRQRAATTGSGALAGGVDVIDPATKKQREPHISLPPLGTPESRIPVCREPDCWAPAPNGYCRNHSETPDE